MKRQLSMLAAAFVLSLGLAGAATHGASADAPSDLYPPEAQAAQGWQGWQGAPPHWGGQRHHGRRHYAPPPRYHGPRYHRRPNIGFYFGAPAPYYEPPYHARPRYHSPRVRGVSSAHVQWCHQRYRSYRAYDNTFQPYNGPRRQCRSPYG